MITIIFVLSFLLVQVIICFVLYAFITNRLNREYEYSDLKIFENEISVISAITDSLIANELLDKNYKFEDDNSFVYEKYILMNIVKRYNMKHITDTILNGIICRSYLAFGAYKKERDMVEFTMNTFKANNSRKIEDQQKILDDFHNMTNNKI